MQRMLVDKQLTGELDNGSLIRIMLKISNLAYCIGRKTEQNYREMLK